MKKRIMAVLLAVILVFAMMPAMEVQAADGVFTTSTTLTKFINRYNNVTIKSGVTVTMKKFSPDPQGLEISGSLIVEPGGALVGPGCIIFQRTSTFSGINLYYRVAGVEKLIPENNFAKLIPPGNNDYQPTFYWNAAAGHYYLVGDFNADPYFDPNASVDAAYATSVNLGPEAPARWGNVVIGPGAVVNITGVNRTIGITKALVVQAGGSLMGGQIDIFTTAAPSQGIQLYYRFNGQIKAIPGNNMAGFWNGNLDPNNSARFTYDASVPGYVLDGIFNGDPFGDGQVTNNTTGGNGGTPISGDVVPVYRVFRPTTGEHLYTISATERDSFVAAGWNDEGVAWQTPAKSDTPVYRVYHRSADYHHYTTSTEERDSLVASGWEDQGIAWYSGGTTPLYRLYDPKATPAGSHHYTMSAEERSQLLASGWNDEGIGWYGK